MTARQAKHMVRLQEWSQMVKNYQESGKNLSEWCSENGITLSCYYYRLAQVRRAVLEDSGLFERRAADTTGINDIPTLVKVNIPQLPQPASTSSEQEGRQTFRLQFNDTVLDIPVGTGAEAIAEVLKALKLNAV